MAVFVILSENPQPDLRANIERTFPEQHFHWSDRVSFVRASGTSRDLAGKIGVQTRGDQNQVKAGLTGVAISELSPNYYGWTNASLWDWLKSSFEVVG